jgi:hypothetical protein
VPGEQVQQPGQARCVIADPLAGQDLPDFVHKGDVVVVFRPVDPAEYAQLSPPLSCGRVLVLVLTARGTRAP